MNQGQIQSFDAYTKLLLAMNGIESSTTFTDSSSSAHVVTAVGNAQINTTNKKFGSASGIFDGSGDYLTTPDHTDFDFSGGIFTVDCWVYIKANGEQCIFYQQTDASNNVYLSTNNNMSGVPVGFQFYVRAGGANVVSLNNSGISLKDRWVHVAVVENGNSWYLFQDGVLVDSETDTDRCANYTGVFTIGSYAGASSYFNGNIDEFRVSKGIARWVSGFVPPTNEYRVTDGTVYEIATTYTETELPELQFAQSADILFIAHPNHVPAQLSRTGHASWTLADCVFKKKYYPALVMLTGDFGSYTLGGEKVQNGTFAVDSKWTKGSGWTISGGKAVRVASAATNLSQNTTEVAGEIYKVTYTLVLTAGTGVTVNIGNIDGTQRTASGTYTEYIAADTDDNLKFVPTADFAGTIDNVSVQKATPIDYSNCIDDNLGSVGFNNDIDAANTFLELNVGTGNTIDLIEIGMYVANSVLNSIFDIEYYDTGTSAWVKVVTGWSMAAEGLGWARKSWTSVGAKQQWRILKTNAGTAGGNVMEVEFLQKINLTDWTPGTYPACVTFFEERLWFAYLQTLWASKSSDFFNFTVGTNDDDSLQYTIGSSHVNKIQWLSSGKILIAGTSGGEYKISASALDEAITPLNVRIVNQSVYGSHYHQAIPINEVTLFITRSRRKIREFAYSFENDIYVSPDMTLLAKHLFSNNILYAAFQKEPYSCLWVVMENGMLLGFTYQRLEGITAWHRHSTDGLFESVTCIPNTLGKGYNEVWTVVQRTINGSTVRYIEMMEADFDGESLNSNEVFFVDSGLSYDGVSVSSVSGLSHLEGETVSVVADGLEQTSKVVASGSITLDTAASKVVAGLPYTSIIQTMRLQRNDNHGTAQGRLKRINQAVIRLYKTKKFKYGAIYTGTLKEKEFNDLYSGDFEVDFVLGWDKEGYVSVVHDNPMPCTVVSIITEGAVN